MIRRRHCRSLDTTDGIGSKLPRWKVLLKDARQSEISGVLLRVLNLFEVERNYICVCIITRLEESILRKKK